ncbi:hypothetical protein H8958_009551 [Nasalis larvatus]
MPPLRAALIPVLCGNPRGAGSGEQLGLLTQDFSPKEHAVLKLRMISLMLLLGLVEELLLPYSPGDGLAHTSTSPEPCSCLTGTSPQSSPPPFKKGGASQGAAAPAREERALGCEQDTARPRRAAAAEEMELTLVGLQYSGKTTFVNVIASGQFNEDMIPTVGFNMRKITKGNVTIKLWDIGGQPRFRSMWERYCRGVSAIVYMVDAADQEKIEASKNELHNLLDKPQLQGIPVLVLGNKRDLPGALDEKELIEKMNLSAIQDREICCYSISCKEKDNIDITLQWLIQHSKSRRS